MGLKTILQLYGRKPGLVEINKKKKAKEKKDNVTSSEFCFLAVHRGKIKEIEKIYNYLDLARELKKLHNMRLTMIANVIGAFGTVPKSLKERL